MPLRASHNSHSIANVIQFIVTLKRNSKESLFNDDIKIIGLAMIAFKEELRYC